MSDCLHGGSNCLAGNPHFYSTDHLFFRKTLLFVEFALNRRNTRHENYKLAGGRAVVCIRGRELTCDEVKMFEIDSIETAGLCFENSDDSLSRSETEV
jgi:hypothetical protein